MCMAVRVRCVCASLMGSAVEQFAKLKLPSGAADAAAATTAAATGAPAASAAGTAVTDTTAATTVAPGGSTEAGAVEGTVVGDVHMSTAEGVVGGPVADGAAGAPVDAPIRSVADAQAALVTRRRDLMALSAMRAEHIGMDRFYNRYWVLTFGDVHAGGRLLVENSESGCMRCYRTPSAVRSLLAWLNPRGAREYELILVLNAFVPLLLQQISFRRHEVVTVRLRAICLRSAPVRASLSV